jgi:hypothetical protein
MKKLLIIVAVVAVLSLLWSCSFSESEEPVVFESGDYKYIVLEEGTAEITKYTGKEKVINQNGKENIYFELYYNCPNPKCKNQGIITNKKTKIL